MTPTPPDKTPEITQDLTPPEDDMLCMNCQYGEWRHGKDGLACKNFDNGLTPPDKDELLQQKQSLNNKLTWIDSVISAYIDGRKDSMGLVLPEVKTQAYSALRVERANIFEQLRQVNSKYSKVRLEQALKEER